MAGEGLKALMLIGSAREGRMADRVKKFMLNQMTSRGWEVDVADPVDLDFPVLKKPIFFYENPEDAPQNMRDLLEKIKTVDAFVIVTCEYNHCLPPGLLNLINHYPPTAFAKRPSSTVCYSPGIYGGMRAAMQARCLLAEINTVNIPNIFGMPQVQNSLDANGNPTDDHMVSGAEKHISELEWYANALKKARENDS